MKCFRHSVLLGYDSDLVYAELCSPPHNWKIHPDGIIFTSAKVRDDYLRLTVKMCKTLYEGRWVGSWEFIFDEI